MISRLGKGFADLEADLGYVTIQGEQKYFNIKVARTRNGSSFQRVTLNRAELEELRNNINHVLITTQ